MRDTLSIQVPRELAEKIHRASPNLVAWCLTPCINPGVPDSPDPDKTMLGIRIDRTLKRRVMAAAKAQRLTLTEYVRSCLAQATAHITLTSADYEKIAADVRKAERQAAIRKPDHNRGQD